MRVHVVACGTSMCICARAHAWLQVGVGKHQRLHDGDRVEVFNRELLRHRTASTPPTHTHHPHSWPAGPVHPLPEHLTLTTGPLDPRLLLQGRGRAGRCRPVTSTAVHIEHKRAQGSRALLAARRADAELCRGCTSTCQHARHVYGGAPGRTALVLDRTGDLSSVPFRDSPLPTPLSIAPRRFAQKLGFGARGAATPTADTGRHGTRRPQPQRTHKN